VDRADDDAEITAADPAAAKSASARPPGALEPYV